jgi:hypothetical protein
MGAYSISQLQALAPLTGVELMELTILSPTVIRSAATISALAADNSINDSGAGFIAAGFTAGMRVNVAGFTGNVVNNVYSAVITALTAGKMTFGGTDGDVLVDDAAGEVVTVTAWHTYRGTSFQVARLLLDNDVTLAGDSALFAATQHAVKTYIDGKVTGLLEDKGPIDCSANPNYPAALKGDAYRVTVAGKIGGAAGVTVDIGDLAVASADNAGGTQAAVGASWYVLEHNLIAAVTAAIASTTEQLTGTENAKLSTPDTVAALWEQGADVASAANISLGEGGYFNVTGVTGITDIDFATDKAGRKAWVKFAAALTLTHSATLILPTAANIVTAAGDTACFISEGADVVRCVSYQRANGQALSGSATALYRPVAFFFTTPPTTSEVLLVYVATEAITFADEFAGSTCSVGTNPTASFVMTVKLNGAAVGTITISTLGVATFVTTGGTVVMASGDRLTVEGPAVVDATAANIAVTLKGAL